MRELTDSTALRDDADALRRRLADDGYLFFRGLVDPARIAGVRAEVCAVLDAAGWLAPGATVEHPVPTPSAVREGAPGYFDAYAGIQALQPFHELAHDPAVVALARGILGEALGQVLVHPRKIARTSLPHDDEYTPPHQEYRLIQGSVDSLTVWLPLGDCPVSLGALRMLEGSHRRGLAPASAARGAGGLAIAVAAADPAWRVSDYTAGDAVLFTSVTVHGAVRNDHDDLRLSADFRYQPLGEPVVEGSLLPHWLPQVPPWEELTAGWTSTASVAAPGGLDIVPLLPPLDPALTAPPSRLFATT